MCAVFVTHVSTREPADRGPILALTWLLLHLHECRFRFIKGVEKDGKQLGGFVGEAPGPSGANGINIGDGFHDYLLAGFVSCYHNNIIPKGRQILNAQLKLRGNSVFGVNPLVIDGTLQMRVDMVRAPLLRGTRRPGGVLKRVSNTTHSMYLLTQCRYGLIGGREMRLACRTRPSAAVRF